MKSWKKDIDDIKSIFDTQNKAYYTRNIIFEVLKQIPLVFCVKDMDFKMVFLSKAYEDEYLLPRGYTVNDYIGRDDFSVWPEEIANNFRENDIKELENFKNNETPDHIEFHEKVIGKEGEVIRLFRKFILRINGGIYIALLQVG